MPKFVIEREIANAGDLTELEIQSILSTSRAAILGLGAPILWIHSYVTGDKIYCVYIAPSEDLIREHARLGGLPANRVSRVRAIIDPTTIS